MGGRTIMAFVFFSVSDYYFIFVNCNLMIQEVFLLKKSIHFVKLQDQL